ncbi:MAG: formylmethanofuran dehydrogenase subunit A [Burkholderiaceae bacterium]|jgi:formylmethanofuran dehydrogenase subunit A
MWTQLRQARIIDPAHSVDGEVRDLYLHDGRICAAPDPQTPIDVVYDVTGMTVMAGAIDLHTHIGGGKTNIARMLLPEIQRMTPWERTPLLRACCGEVAPATWATGYRYAEMGYTACFEPAIVPTNARQAHLEMGDIPIIDKGGYAMLGNDDFLLSLLSGPIEQGLVDDYVAWTLDATQCLGLKVVNPGGINAFKFNARKLDLDEPGPHYHVAPRTVLTTLARSLYNLGVPHPLHVHGCNLGAPGNVDTTLETIAGVEGLPMHLTHIQFHSYGKDGPRGFSSGAARIAEAINRNPNISADVGQIMFGQTVTTSADTMAQHQVRRHAHPKKWVLMDIECEAGCGVVPFRYRDQNFVNALQWAIGLEIFLMVDDPWRIFLTTDHPNGAPFTSYPHLIRLLMDRSFRNEKLASIAPAAQAASELGALDREYTLYEIAILTRAGPARVLGLSDRGHLGEGAAADITVYRDNSDREAMFSKPAYVFKDGTLVARDGQIVAITRGATHTVKPSYDGPALKRRLGPYFERHASTALSNFAIDPEELCECGSSRLLIHECLKRS